MVLIASIRECLVRLKIPRAREELIPAMARMERGESTILETLHSILGEKLALREGRRIYLSLRTARLTPPKTMDSYDFSFQPSLDRERVEALASLEFMNRKEAVHFLGPPAPKKTRQTTCQGEPKDLQRLIA